MQPTKQPIETLVTAEQFWAFFSAVPEEQWHAGDFECAGKKCARGHLGSNDVTGCCEADYQLGKVLGVTASVINDGRHPGYQQPTPKQRILAALADKMEVRP